MGKQIACNDIVAGCSFTATAGNEKELLEKVACHATEQHGVTEVTPDLVAKVRAAIQDR